MNAQREPGPTSDGSAVASLASMVTVDECTEGRGEDARQVKRIKIKLFDKRAALVDLGRHLGLFKDKGDAPRPR